MERVITVKRLRPAEDGQGETYKLYMSPRMEVLRIPFEIEDDFFSVINDWVAIAKRHGDTVVLLLETDVPSYLLMWRSERTITKLLWLNKDGTREHILNELEDLIVRAIRKRGGKATTGELARDPMIVDQLGCGVDVVDILLPLSNSGVVEWEYLSGPSDNLHGCARLLEP
jgi:hypothetical protein